MQNQNTMLDKSLPYKSITMRMEAAVAQRLASPASAAGYRIRPFAPGDERHWARIETSVGEFSEEAAVRAYFERAYLPEAIRRYLFVVTERDEPVAPSPLRRAVQLAPAEIDEWRRTAFRRSEGSATLRASRCSCSGSAAPRVPAAA